MLLQSNLFSAVTPDPPGIVNVDDITRNSVDLSWEKPKNDGGKPITGYVIEKKKGDGEWETATKVPAKVGCAS